MSLASELLRPFFLLAGVVCFYMAFFMYEDEGGKLQNRLVNLWVTVSQKGEASLSEQAKLIKYSSQIVSSSMRRILGPKLISARTITVSAALSMASTGFMAALLSYTRTGVIIFSISSIACFCYGLFIAPTLFKTQRAKLGVVILLSLIVTTYFFEIFSNDRYSVTVFRADWNGFYDLYLMAIPALALGVLADVLLISVNRWVADKMSSAKTGRVLLLGTIFNLICSVGLIALLHLYFRWPGKLGVIEQSSFAIAHWNDDFANNRPFVTTGILLTVCSDLFTLIAAASVVIVALSALAHRLLWPVLGRSVNGLYAWNIFTSRKTQLSLGVFFISLAFTPHWVTALLHPK
jgi:hypothetical protein